MIKELEFSNKVKFVVFQKENFWDKILPKDMSGSAWIDVVTYNFNFDGEYSNSVVRKLEKLSQNGVNVRLLYGIKGDNEVRRVSNEIFNLSIPIFYLEGNHSKIFLSENIGFIGSANFSYGSNNNLESGILLEDKNTILQIRKILIEEYFTKAELVDGDNLIPCEDHLLFRLLELLDAEYNRNGHFRELLTKESVGELRNYDDVIKYAREFGIDIVYSRIIWAVMDNVFSGKELDKEIVEEADRYILQLYCEITEFKEHLLWLYRKIGRVALHRDLENGIFLEKFNDGGYSE